MSVNSYSSRQWNKKMWRTSRLTWWRHQMETFSVLLVICAGNSPVPGEFAAQRAVMRSFDGFFDLRLNKRLSKQSWGWWFETLSCPLWRHCNDGDQITVPYIYGTCTYMVNSFPLGKMAVFSQTTYSIALSWMKMYEFRLRFHWNLFPRVQLTISQHWFR